MDSNRPAFLVRLIGFSNSVHFNGSNVHWGGFIKKRIDRKKRSSLDSFALRPWVMVEHIILERLYDDYTLYNVYTLAYIYQNISECVQTMAGISSADSRLCGQDTQQIPGVERNIQKKQLGQPTYSLQIAKNYRNIRLST